MIKAKIKNIKNHENINWVEFSTQNHIFFMLSLELNEKACINHEVLLAFKSSECLLSKKNLENSFLNTFYAKIIDIFQGKIITIIRLENEVCTFEAQISTFEFLEQNYQLDEYIFAYIHPSALFIKEYLC
ncbi:hypothetical protein [Campylobacter armoricus]|uniref:Molybdenum-pterin binding domain-containing protein n=1 Tax=Campylobacter armoricus TaxID=2505970 RepID=A0A7L5ICC1_9BACT|nr:hypothetical protein [Campylobacter armoricus]QKF80213.1 molybdenum-pterin binding domain-containing protein [Campylobacter armoricus]